MNELLTLCGISTAFFCFFIALRKAVLEIEKKDKSFNCGRCGRGRVSLDKNRAYYLCDTCDFVMED